jgi:hypothetical protein
MKKQKKFGRKLQLNKETIAKLNQKKVLAGKPPIPCGTTFPTEVICTVADCYTIHFSNCVTNCVTDCAPTCHTVCDC